MSEQDSTISSEAEDVEAHGRRRTAMASDEPRDETTSEEDVELHGKKNVMASDQPAGEFESEDDVELHGQKRKTL